MADGCWEDFTARFREGEDHSRFSYRVRPSSTDFFNELVTHHPPLPVAELKDLKGWITDQPWYYRYWRLDPTIQGTLEMLQAMRDLFAASPHRDLYARLTDPQRPAITFQLLDLGDFPLSDDLYIKMNARGKLLTSFETFKARYEQALPGHFASAPPRAIGNATFALAEFVLRRFDNAWTDLLWTHHLDRSRIEPKYLAPGQPTLPQRLDESFMHIFRLVALATRDPAHADFQADIKRCATRQIRRRTPSSRTTAGSTLPSPRSCSA